MSIIIKGMDMPPGAKQIWIDVWSDGELLANNIFYIDEIVEIPTPHGRLIDEDNIKIIAVQGQGIEVDAPTILEAEE